MKKVNVVIIAVLIATCVIGWVTIGAQHISKDKKSDEYVRQADEWVSKGLYQRAIKNYELAVESNPEEKIFVKAIKAFDARYDEAPEDTIGDYISFMENAVSHYPASHTLVDKMVELYTIDSDPEGIYNCLTAAIKEGYDTKDVQKKLVAAQYAHSLKNSAFSAIRQSVGDVYTVSRNGLWNTYSLNDGYLMDSEYEYVGLSNSDGVVVITGKDSRIMDADRMVMGIFDGKVTDSGLFSEGLIPACIDGKYAFYDEFAEKKFGDYEMAGCFQNGKAAVKSDGKWMLIDSKGKTVSDEYEEIVLDSQGRYLVGDMFLAKKKGEYGLFDKKLHEKIKLDCSDTDILTKDGLIAFCKGDKWGFVNTDGKVVIKPEYKKAKSFSNGLAAVFDGDKWGFINKRNVLVIDYGFVDAGYMGADGNCPVRTDTPEAESDPGEKKTDLETWRFMELEIGLKED